MELQWNCARLHLIRFEEVQYRAIPLLWLVINSSLMKGTLILKLNFSIFKKDQVIFFFLWNRGFCISVAWFLGAPDKGFQKECPAVQNKDS